MNVSSSIHPLPHLTVKRLKREIDIIAKDGQNSGPAEDIGLAPMVVTTQSQFPTYLPTIIALLTHSHGTYSRADCTIYTPLHASTRSPTLV